jgi:outer membrane protein OmpA-like peptidoglycan-associated protein
MRKTLLALCLLVTTAATKAQTYPGYRTSNYTGVNGVFFNPANIADNYFKWDVNIFAINGFVGTTSRRLRFSDLTHSFSADTLKSKLLRGGKHVNSLSYADILGPSFMISLSPKSTIALTTRTRIFANGRDIDGDLAGTVIDKGKTTANIPFDFNTNMLVHGTGWTEFGVSWGQVFTNKGSHNFFKGGITLKYLAGTADSYLSTTGLAGTVDGPGNTFLTNSTGSVAINTTNANFVDYKFKDFFRFNGHGVGGDIGLVYEYRPVTDSSRSVTDRPANKYKFRVAVSLLDVGRISFSRSTNQASVYSVNIPPTGQFLLNQLAGKHINQYKAILDASPYFTGTDQGSSYDVNLPTSLQADIDYLLAGGFAINAAGQFNLNHQGTLNLYNYNSYSLTPRWENSLISVQLPLNYNQLTKFNAGVAFRIGQFFIGSGSLLSALVRDSKQVDLHVGVHFGMPFSKKAKPDTDKDKDKDGVYDDVDKCPLIAGLPRYNGCPIPDTDGDDINDEEDSCKTVAGVRRYNGCPIPDTDGDGVYDDEDSCKTVPGLNEFHGCPDTDRDGIPDKDDKCPTVAGLAQYQGCPIPDTDGDGIPDDKDLCPNEVGFAFTKGCPIEKVVQQISGSFRNILFDYGKTTIRPESDTILTNAAKIMKEQLLNSSFYIDGYSDSKGSVAVNQRLSRARAQAVANALIKGGIDKSRITVRGFGKDNPICDNNTAEGRQCNRRVEMVIRNVNQKKAPK